MDSNQQDQVALLRRDKLRLQKEVHDLQVENRILHEQHHQTSLLLEAALAKLESLGYSIISPYDIGAGIKKIKDFKATTSWTPRDEGADGGGSILDGSRREGSGVGPTKANPKTGGRKFTKQPTELKHENSAVQCVSFSPDGRHIASGVMNKKVYLWNFQSSKLSTTLEKHSMPISDLAWSPDGKLLTTAGYDGESYCWDMAGSPGTTIHSSSGNGYILSCAFLPNSQHVYACSDTKRHIYLVDVRERKSSVAQWTFPAKVNTLCPEYGHRMIAGDAKGVVSLLDMRMGAVMMMQQQQQQQQQARNASVSPVQQQSPDDASNSVAPFAASTAATPSGSNTNNVNGSNGNGNGNINNNDGSSSNNAALRSIAPTSQQESTPQVTSGTVLTAAASANTAGSQLLYQQQQQQTPSCVVQAWNNEESNACIWHASLHRSHNDDTLRLLVVSDDCTVRLYDHRLSSGSSSAAVATAAFAPQAKDPGTAAPIMTGLLPAELASAESAGSLSAKQQHHHHHHRSGGGGGVVGCGILNPINRMGGHVYSLQHIITGLKTRSYPIRAGYRACNERNQSFSFEDNPAGNDDERPRERKFIVDSDILVVGGTDNNVRVYDVSGGGTTIEGGGPLELLQLLEGHKDVCYGAVFHPSDAVIASYSADATIKIWAPSKK